MKSVEEASLRVWYAKMGRLFGLRDCDGSRDLKHPQTRMLNLPVSGTEACYKGRFGSIPSAFGGSDVETTLRRFLQTVLQRRETFTS